MYTSSLPRTNSSHSGVVTRQCVIDVRMQLGAQSVEGHPRRMQNVDNRSGGFEASINWEM